MTHISIAPFSASITLDFTVFADLVIEELKKRPGR